MKSEKKSFNLIKNILFYLLAFLLASYLIVDLIVPEKTVSIFGVKTFVIVSDSMEPTINVNDAVVVRKIDPEKLIPGNIITFEAYLPDLGQRAYVTHYIGEIIPTSDGFIFKTLGEGVMDYDQWKDELGTAEEITEDSLIGIVAFRIPKAGHVFKIIQDPILLSLIVVNVGIIIYIVHYIKKTKTKEIDKEE